MSNSISNLEIFFIILLIFYILIQPTFSLYNMNSTNLSYIYIILIVIAIILTMYVNIFIVILFLISSLIFINNINQISSEKIIPSENKKVKKLNTYNKHLSTKSLEEEIVSKISNNIDNSPDASNYKPTLCDIHNANYV